MPPFPERESSLLAKLKKKKGGAEKDDKETLEPPAPAAPNAPVTQQTAQPSQPLPAARVSVYPSKLNLEINSRAFAPKKKVF